MTGVQTCASDLTPLLIDDITGAEIKSPLRGGVTLSFYYYFTWIGNEDEGWGAIWDQKNIWSDYGTTTLGGKLEIQIGTDLETPNIQEGDYLELAYDGTTKNIYFPTVSSDTTLYVGADGSTYTDELLCTVAYTAPTPTQTITPSITPAPTITPTPTMSPTSTPTRTLTITPTPTQTPTGTPTQTPTMSPTSTPSGTPTETPTTTPTRPATETPQFVPTPTPTPTVIPQLAIFPSPLAVGQPFTLGILLTQDLNTPFDPYILADTPAGVYNIRLNGSITPGITPLFKNVLRFDAPFAATILPTVRIPASMKAKTVTFYTAVVEAGKVPPVRNLEELSPNSPYVIMMDKKTVIVN